MNHYKADLTDSEWMSLLDGERDGLPRCCANISALRDDIMFIVRNGCELTDFDRMRVLMHYAWVIDGHDFPEDGPLRKLAAAFEFTEEELSVHQAEGFES